MGCFIGVFKHFSHGGTVTGCTNVRAHFRHVRRNCEHLKCRPKLLSEFLVGCFIGGFKHFSHGGTVTGRTNVRAYFRHVWRNCEHLKCRPKLGEYSHITAALSQHCTYTLINAYRLGIAYKQTSLHKTEGMHACQVRITTRLAEGTGVWRSTENTPRPLWIHYITNTSWQRWTLTESDELLHVRSKR